MTPLQPGLPPSDVIVQEDVLQLRSEIQVLQQQNQVLKMLLFFNENFHDFLKCEGFVRL